MIRDLKLAAQRMIFPFKVMQVVMKSQMEAYSWYYYRFCVLWSLFKSWGKTEVVYMGFGVCGLWILGDK